MLGKLKACLEAGRITVGFAFEFLILLTQRQLAKYATLGMAAGAYAKTKEMLARGQMRPSVCFTLMYKRIATLRTLNKRRLYEAC